MSREKLLITGGAGFVGSNLIRYLSGNNKFEISVLDNESLGKEANIGPYEYNFIKADIRDERAVREALTGVKYLIHLAADTRVMDSIQDPAKNFEVNVLATFRLLEQARELGISRIIFASTGGAILGDVAPPINEEMVARPLAPYGASKLAIEGYLSAYSASYNLPSIVLRFSNIYGVNSYHKGSVVAHFFKQILLGDDLIVFGDGTQKRDFLYVDDLMKGIEDALYADANGVYQLGSGKPTSVNELIDAMRAVIGDEFKINVLYKDFRPGEVKETWCDISRARMALGFNPDTKLIDGLSRTWNWFKQNYSVSIS